MSSESEAKYEEINCEKSIGEEGKKNNFSLFLRIVHMYDGSAKQPASHPPPGRMKLSLSFSEYEGKNRRSGV